MAGRAPIEGAPGLQGRMAIKPTGPGQVVGATGLVAAGPLAVAPTAMVGVEAVIPEPAKDRRGPEVIARHALEVDVPSVPKTAQRIAVAVAELATVVATLAPRGPRRPVPARLADPAAAGT